MVLGTAFASFAQDAAEKQILAGLTLGGAMSFNSSQTNTMDSKVGGAFLAGMALDWSFSKNVGLTTGLEFEFDNFTTIYKDKPFFDYDDREIIRHKELGDKSYESFRLDERKHSNINLTLPVMLKFQTNYLGYFRYFGRFGIRNTVNLMNRTKNMGEGFENVGSLIMAPTDVSELKEMRSKGLMSFYRGSVGITGGAEYNITGNTVLVAELGYFYGFTEMFAQRDNIRSLYNLDEDGIKPTDKSDYYVPSMKQGQLMLKVSVLF